MIWATLDFMISLLVCSVQPDLLERVKGSVESTIGTKHEWLVADNRNTGKGICQVYNELAEQAQYPYLLFLHEDVTFHTANWGAILIRQFETDSQLGLVGLAGATCKSASISGWYTGNAAFDRFHITHQMPGSTEFLNQVPDDQTDLFPVVCLDGVFLCCRRSVWENIRFDADHLNGFHFYDLDFSLRVAARYRVAVTTRIDLIHHTKSGGDYGSRWIREALAFHKRWSNRLPTSVSNSQVSEASIQRLWLDRLKDQRVRFSDRFRFVSAQRLWRSPASYYSVLKFFLYRPLRLRYLHRYLRNRKSAQ